MLIDSAMPLDELVSEALRIRSFAFGNRMTYSPKVFIPLTQLCRDHCGYCTFARPPARLASDPYLGAEEVLAIARAGRAQGCWEALFTLGEEPEARYPEARAALKRLGAATTTDYLVEMARLVLQETGMLPHANAGSLGEADLAAVRAVSASQGMMLETTAERLGGIGGPHARCQTKVPARRLATLDAAGRLAIPFTTGILVGIGETRSERLQALDAIAASHRAHGHIQEVIVQNFVPKPATAMAHAPAPSPEEYLWTIAAARVILPASIHLQAPPNLSDDFGALLEAGIDDWGGVSPVTADHVNPERPWPELDLLRTVTAAHGYVLAPRLTVYPEFLSQPHRWLDEALRFPALRARDADGLAREDGWSAGGATSPPALLSLVRPDSTELGDVDDLALSLGGDTAGGGGTGAGGEKGGGGAARVVSSLPLPRGEGRVAEVLAGVGMGQQLGEEEIVALFRARGPEVHEVADYADQLRRARSGDDVTFVRNRNINYTNVCTFRCTFCAFSKGPRSLSLRGDPYLLSVEEVVARVVEARDRGATEVTLQGGIHPHFDGETYVTITQAVHAAVPDMHIHGFTALEVHEGARRLGEPLHSYLRRLKKAGLKTLPGTAAEVLDDEVRAVLCPDKVTTEQWLEVHAAAHDIGLQSNVTIMFGHVEEPRHWARHILRTRALQERTHGFTEFVPLPFVHMAAPLYRKQRSRPGPTFREVVLMHAVARIAYAGAIDNVQVSWVKLGAQGVRQTLRAGVNDLGGTLMDENISRAAGASHGQGMEVDDLQTIVAPLGRRLVQRSTLYDRIAPDAVTV